MLVAMTSGEASEILDPSQEETQGYDTNERAYGDLPVLFKELPGARIYP